MKSEEAEFGAEQWVHVTDRQTDKQIMKNTDENATHTDSRVAYAMLFC